MRITLIWEETDTEKSTNVKKIACTLFLLKILMSVMLFVMGVRIECNYHMRLSEGGAEGLEKFYNKRRSSFPAGYTA